MRESLPHGIAQLRANTMLTWAIDLQPCTLQHCPEIPALVLSTLRFSLAELVGDTDLRPIIVVRFLIEYTTSQKRGI